MDRRVLLVLRILPVLCVPLVLHVLLVLQERGVRGYSSPPKGLLKKEAKGLPPRGGKPPKPPKPLKGLRMPFEKPPPTVSSGPPTDMDMSVLVLTVITFVVGLQYTDFMMRVLVRKGG